MAERPVTERPNHWYWYHSKAWKDLRRKVLRANPYCTYCKEKGRLVTATVADHVIAHRGRWGMFMNPHNIQPLCASCHSGVKKRIDYTHWREDRAMDKYETDKDGWIIRRKCT